MRVELVVRGQCTLCPAARAVVADVCQSRGIGWREIDLSGEFGVTDIAPDGQSSSTPLTADQLADAREKWADLVPVVLVDGEAQGYWTINAARLAAALDPGAGDGRVLRA